MKKFEIIPSVLSANFMDLKHQLTELFKNNIQWIHYDVMDYDFVPNLTFGAKILSDIVSETQFKIDIHFMVKVKTRPFTAFFGEYLKLKPAMMTMHIEAMNVKETDEFITFCQQHKIIASLAIKPKTDIEAIKQYLPVIDNVLVMTVEPGFGGQKFLELAATKIQKLKTLANVNNYHYTVEVDGGINLQTVKIVKEYDIDGIVVGSYLFDNFSNLTQVLSELQNGV